MPKTPVTLFRNTQEGLQRLNVGDDALSGKVNRLSTIETLGKFSDLLTKLKFLHVPGEIEDNLDRITDRALVVVNIDIRLQLEAISHHLLTPL